MKKKVYSSCTQIVIGSLNYYNSKKINFNDIKNRIIYASFLKLSMLVLPYIYFFMPFRISERNINWWCVFHKAYSCIQHPSLFNNSLHATDILAFILYTYNHLLYLNTIYNIHTYIQWLSLHYKRYLFFKIWTAND